MNVVCMLYYLFDKYFFEVCDEFGFYVFDEFVGWQGFYDILIGVCFIGQIVCCDVNYLSIFFWDNGNEGGWNIDNDGEFVKWDL